MTKMKGELLQDILDKKRKVYEVADIFKVSIKGELIEPGKRSIVCTGSSMLIYLNYNIRSRSGRIIIIHEKKHYGLGMKGKTPEEKLFSFKKINPLLVPLL